MIGDDFPKVLETDEDDPPDSDVYNISAQPYPLDPRWHVGFPSFFQREKSTSDSRLDAPFIGCRDGFQWHRYDRAPYARPGLAGSESANMVFIGPWLILRGEEIRQYGTGFHTHATAAKRRASAKPTASSTVMCSAWTALSRSTSKLAPELRHRSRAGGRSASRAQS